MVSPFSRGSINLGAIPCEAGLKREIKIHRIFIEVVIMTLGGLTIFAFYWFIYLGIYLGLEALFYVDNPTDFPAIILQSSLAILLITLYIAFLFSKANKLVKITLGIAPVAVCVIAFVLRSYDNILLYLGAVTIFSTIFNPFDPKKSILALLL